MNPIQDAELQALRCENELLRSSIEIYAKSNSQFLQNSQGAVFTAARLERIDENMLHVLGSLSTYSVNSRALSQQLKQMFDWFKKAKEKEKAVPKAKPKTTKKKQATKKLKYLRKGK